MNANPPRHTIELRPVALSTWSAFTQNAVPFVVAAAVVVLLVPLTLTVLTGPLMLGLIHMATRALGGERVELAHLWLGFENVGRPIVAWFLIALSVVIGLVPLLLPGIALSLLWLYSFWFVASSDMLPSDALRASWRLVRVNLPSTILLGLLIVLLNALGTFLVVGVFASLPLSVLLVTASYQQLGAEADG
ncbi:MAG: hypothetical protein AAFX94_08720 [Myxococcota bacterium]